MSVCDTKINETSVKIPILDRKKYAVYKAKFRAVGAIKKWGPALNEDFKNQLPAREDTVLDPTNESEKKQMLAKAKNAMAVHYLTLSFESDEDIGMIEEARTEEWPCALACDIWAALEEENTPSDTLAIVGLQKQLTTLNLKSDEDPNKLAERMAALIGRYKCTVDQEQRIAVLVNAAGRKYAETIRQETAILELKSKPVTVKALIRAMHEKWRISGADKCSYDSDDEPTEAMIAILSESATGVAKQDILRMTVRTKKKRERVIVAERRVTSGETVRSRIPLVR